MTEATGDGYTALDSDGFQTANEILGHIAHDFGNLVTPLLAYPELIKSEFEEGAFARGLIEQIEVAAASMARITQQLQLLSNRLEADCEPIDLSCLCRDVVVGVQIGDTPDSVCIEMDLAEEPLPMQGNVTQLSAAIYNLCLNAIESMPDGGTMTVSTARRRTQVRQCCYGGRIAEGEYLQVEVIDQGTGVPEHLRPRLFNPFVTSRNSAEKRGAGLGLAIVYKAARDHGGYADFRDLEGGGSAFCIGFPTATQSEPRS